MQNAVQISYANQKDYGGQCVTGSSDDQSRVNCKVHRRPRQRKQSINDRRSRAYSLSGDVAAQTVETAVKSSDKRDAASYAPAAVLLPRGGLGDN